jgi:hypothetical protein
MSQPAAADAADDDERVPDVCVHILTSPHD